MDQKKSCSVVVNVNVNKSNINEAVERITTLRKELEEAKASANEVASFISDIRLDINLSE